ncbi:MAG: SDR family NAD(P)-dependent oxidoreductase [Lewinellaceae bacterium]|nr:SDR family NAD(P)-dependent oxidoreductase [Lewinellaceae bacterium]
MDINFSALSHLTKALLPSMMTHQLGINVLSPAWTGKFGSPLRSASAASKHALHGFFDIFGPNGRYTYSGLLLPALVLCVQISVSTH